MISGLARATLVRLVKNLRPTNTRMASPLKAGRLPEANVAGRRPGTRSVHAHSAVLIQTAANTSYANRRTVTWHKRWN